MVIIQVESKEDNTELMFAAELALGDTLHEKRWNNDNWVRTAYITVVTVVTEHRAGYHGDLSSYHHYHHYYTPHI